MGFRGFNGRLVAKSPGKTIPYEERITYNQFLRYLSLWFSGVLETSPKEFRKQFETQSGRSGGPSATANAGVKKEFWVVMEIGVLGRLRSIIWLWIKPLFCRLQGL